MVLRVFRPGIPVEELENETLPDENRKAVRLLRYMCNGIWNHLQVTNYIDTVSFVLLLRQTATGNAPHWEAANSIFAYVNLLAELLDYFSSFCYAVRGSKIAILEEDHNRSDVQRPVSLFYPENGDDTHALRIRHHTLGTVKSLETEMYGPKLDPQSFNVVKAFLWTAWQRSLILHFHAVVAVQLKNGY